MKVKFLCEVVPGTRRLIKEEYGDDCIGIVEEYNKIRHVVYSKGKSGILWMFDNIGDKDFEIILDKPKQLSLFGDDK